MAIMLKSRFVGLTAGLVNPRKLTWNGSRTKAPEIPPVEVSAEMAKAMRIGSHHQVSTPLMENSIIKDFFLPQGV